MAAQLATTVDTWDLHHFLSHYLRDIERKYDYRYTQLILVFGCPMREEWMDESDLDGLAAEEIDAIRHIANFWRGRATMHVYHRELSAAQKGRA